MFYRDLDADKIIANYERVYNQKCPKCGKQMTPLGDSYVDPYYYCFDCGIELPR